MRTTGEILDVHADTARLRVVGAEGLAELLVACAERPAADPAVNTPPHR
jgi:hypothetical protein